MDFYQVDNACMNLYTSPEQSKRLEAEKYLKMMFPTFNDSSTSVTINDSNNASTSGPFETIQKCHSILEQTKSSYSQLFLINILQELAIHWQIYSVEQKVVMRNFILMYLGNRCPFEQFVINSISKYFTLITKLGWFDTDEFRDIVNDFSKFIESNHVCRHTGLQVLAFFVTDMNLPSQILKNISKNRKTVVNFRDSQLHQIFRLSLSTLLNLIQGKSMLNIEEQKLAEITLELIRACLTFDFIGTNTDESTEEIGSIQIPVSWRPTISDPLTLKTIFHTFELLNPPRSSKVLECVSVIVATRRTLFSEEERSKFIKSIMQELMKILHLPQAFNDQSNYHEFCRILSRFKTVYQLSDINKIDEYEEFINIVTDFTIKSLQSTQTSLNSIQYLLVFWSKMVTAVGQSKPQEDKELHSMTSQIIQAFLNSRIENNIEEIEDELDKDANLSILDNISHLIRFSYKENSTYLMKYIEMLAIEYRNIIDQIISNNIPIQVQESIRKIEGKFIWLINVCAMTVGIRIPYQSTEEDDIIDGEICCKIMQLLNLNQMWMTQKPMFIPNNKLEMAFLYFFSNFRKSYIGDQSQRTSKVFQPLADMFSINDQYLLMDYIFQKIITNLKCWAQDTSVITETLNLFSDLTSGYSSVRIIRKLDSAKYILANHYDFQFLNIPENFKKNRINYYSSLSRLLFADDTYETEFNEFFKNHDMKLKELEKLNSIESYRQENVRCILEGIFRDLRGFTMTCTQKKNFWLFFDWIYPYHDVILKAVESNFDHPVSITVLRFVSELANNRSSRLNFEITSANGILLFREISKIICTFGNLILGRLTTEERKYTDIYKGIIICFNILENALKGRYISFGVMKLYGDKALTEVINTYYKLMLFVPLSDMINIPKLSKAHFSLLETFSNDQMMSTDNFNSDAFLYIIKSCAEGIKQFNSSISTEACAVINQICTCVFKENEKRVNSNHKPHILVQFFNQYPQTLSFLLHSILDVIIFEDCPNNWSYSRPLLGLILLAKEEFISYTSKLIQSQIPERRESFSQQLSNLMENVEDNLSSKNRDTFTQNLVVFRREMNNNMVALVNINDNSSYLNVSNDDSSMMQ
ncbi:exportin-7 [Anaeromyces robustus]|uniref:Exportin-7 n=1 Tax=Anaeromyces robustus TaxID=1754192 RepID=A0A1Y1XBT7_9FUNG|nr:exportin-7 [Anaeromyces robustus]|eukprot:ORX83183.1 exportin-7 [Anaeromyces robustus]